MHSAPWAWASPRLAPSGRLQRVLRVRQGWAIHRDKRRLYFLRHAATVRRNGQSETESIWLQAAAHLHGIDDDPVGALTQMLIEQPQSEAQANYQRRS